MSAPRRRRRRSVFLVVAIVMGVSVGAWRVAGLEGSDPAAAATDPQPPTAGDAFEPVLGAPVKGGIFQNSVTVLGASPLESPGETWGYGAVGDVPANIGGATYANQYVLLETSGNGPWQIVPLPAGPQGRPLSSDHSDAFPAALGPLAGRTTGSGGVVLLTEGGIVLRDPGAAPRLIADPNPQSVPAVIGQEESLPPARPPENATTPMAAIEEAPGRTGLLIVPYGESAQHGALARGVLRYDGSAWTRERIVLEEPLASEHAQLTTEALACGASAGADATARSPENCWLLAAYRSEGSNGAPDRLALFRRTRVSSGVEAGSYRWVQLPVSAGFLDGSSPASALGPAAQMLTVTSQGVWVDFKATPSGASRPVSVSELVGAGQAATTRQWCYPPSGPSCPSLGATLPSNYQSFAWPGSGEDPGTRIITGLRAGALLELAGGQYSYQVGAGGQVEGRGGAAFATPQQGWIANGVGAFATDGEGQSQLIHVTTEPQGDQLTESPVPFRYPLLAVAQAPGTTPGDPTAPAIAVGLRGQIGRYVPGQGWRPESLLDGAGRVQTPTLRGAAWPEPGRVYAVGDNGAMWVWRADTGLWEPDPAKPINFIANLNAIAFSPANPSVGYAVGKGGTLLAYGKTWVQEQLPPELQHVNFTSIAFAGEEAIASFRTVTSEPESFNGPVEEGGLAIKEGERPWHVDPGAAPLLAELPHAKDTMLSKVAGLSDGGAVAAGPGVVIERDSQTGSWRFSPQPLPEARNVSALAAYREGSGPVRAIVSIDLNERLDPDGQTPLETGAFAGDVPPPIGPGQPSFLPPSDPLPDGGYLLRETASGWSDMEHMALQAPSGGDMPVRPDPALALLVDPSGDAGLAVGGQTYDTAGANTGSTFSGPEAPFETAAAMRFGAGAAVGGDRPATATATPGDAAMAVGGSAACVQECAAMANEDVGPDVALIHALQRAGQLAAGGGVREFLYTGGRLEQPPPVAAEDPTKLEDSEAAERELTRFAGLLGGSVVPVRVAASTNEVLGAGLAAFTASLAPFLPGAENGDAYYAYTSASATGGSVRVIVLDYSKGELESVQREWLETELAVARRQRVSAIVMGNASLGFRLTEGPAPQLARDAAAVSAIIVRGGASAYLFDYPGANVQTQLSYGSQHIPAFGTGTLGYTPPPAFFQTDSLGSSGFLVLDVHTSAPMASGNVVPVTARIEPNIGELALDATDGVLLRRSQVALFEALARRPAQGVSAETRQSGTAFINGADPYDPIPFDCLGVNCANEIPTEYTFTSSNPEIGNFVAHDPTSANPRQVLLGANELPVADSHSGLFCAFNAGATTVSITAGGLTYSEPVTVQAGSVEYPCGTVPVKNQLQELPISARFVPPTLTPAPVASPPVNPPLPILLAPPPPPRAGAPVPPIPPAPAPPPFFVPPVFAAPLLAFVVPPAPAPTNPTPPTGTAAVTSPVQMAEREEEEESATESASNQAVAYRAEENEPAPAYLLGVILLAAFAGAYTVRGRPRRGRRAARVAPATVASSRLQRRMSRGGRNWR